MIPVDVNVGEVPREELPGLLGRLVELEAWVRIRLAEAPAAPAPAPRLLTADEAAAIAGVSKRAILAKTRGLRLRCDLSRKAPRLEETAFRAWLARRRR